MKENIVATFECFLTLMYLSVNNLYKVVYNVGTFTFISCKTVVHPFLIETAW